MEASDRRRHRRREAAFRARIVFCNGSTAVPCLVQNISSSGAKLALVTAVDLPWHFELEIPQLALKVEARVVWRRAEQCGVTFAWPQHARAR
jgi:hypothetical protein